MTNKTQNSSESVQAIVNFFDREIFKKHLSRSTTIEKTQDVWCAAKPGNQTDQDLALEAQNNLNKFNSVYFDEKENCSKLEKIADFIVESGKNEVRSQQITSKMKMMALATVLTVVATAISYAFKAMLISALFGGFSTLLLMTIILAFAYRHSLNNEAKGQTLFSNLFPQSLLLQKKIANKDALIEIKKKDPTVDPKQYLLSPLQFVIEEIMSEFGNLLNNSHLNSTIKAVNPCNHSITTVNGTRVLSIGTNQASDFSLTLVQNTISEEE